MLVSDRCISMTSAEECSFASGSIHLIDCAEVFWVLLKIVVLLWDDDRTLLFFGGILHRK